MKGLRAVAIFEGLKGSIALLAAAGVPYFHHLAGRLHLNAGKHHRDLLARLLQDLSNAQLWMIAALVVAYAIVRFVEAYGLWRARAWAQWLAAVSGGIYVPFEVYELTLGFSWLKAGALAANLAVVAFMVYALRRSRRSPSTRPPGRNGS